MGVEVGGSTNTSAMTSYLNTINTNVAVILSYVNAILSNLNQFTFDKVRAVSLIIIDEPHSYIHGDASKLNGYFEYFTDVELIASGATNHFILIETPAANTTHLTFTVRRTIETQSYSYGAVLFFEDADASGRPAPTFDRNRIRNSTAYTIIKNQVSLNNPGNLIYSELYGDSVGTDEHSHDRKEFILKNNTVYLISFTNLSSNDSAHVQIILNWYEPEKV